ncbi:ABC transporter substrate-binding protein [Hamadaea tsunoensis]|uniref:ABC transporter substrate-binding protein n=1 Tax=Hamadaea tsunoensis TaxID=53368 RepID=UPI0003F5B359|nr:ABC transporter substrate-binding protein [Hamadaea tsunoensis]
MRTDRARLSIVVVAVSALVGTAACAPSPERVAKGSLPELVIGADLELSGAYAEMGQAYERALRLRVDQINATAARPVRIVIKDNRSDKSLSQQNIGTLAADPTISAIITGACAECAMASVGTVTERGVPLLSLSGATEVADPKKAGKFVFKVGPNPKDSAASLVGELHQQKIGTTAVIATNDAYGDDGVAALTDALKNADVQLAETRRVAVTATEVGQTVAAALASDPESLIVWTGSAQANAIAVEARGAGYTGQILFDTGAGGDLFFGQATAHAAEGALMAFPQTMVIDEIIATSPAKSTRQQWFRDYTSAYGEYVGYASFAADALQLVVEAVAQGGGTARASVQATLQFLQIDGYSGPLSLLPDDHSAVMPQALTMLVVRGGRWRLSE